MDRSFPVFIANEEKRPSTTARRRRKSGNFRRSFSHSTDHQVRKSPLEQHSFTYLSASPHAATSADTFSSTTSLKKENSSSSTAISVQPLPSTMHKGIVATRMTPRRRRIKRTLVSISTSSRRKSTDACKAPVNTSDESSDDRGTLSSDSADDMEGMKVVRSDVSCRYVATDSSRRRIGLCEKYEPKVFEDIIGHEINNKALSNAIHMGKIAPLYLFHGPGGTGKTSTAKVFTMASNCESDGRSNKPCWSCRGCSRSLYITELCSGSRSSGFQKIRTLLQSTTFTWSFSGFKIFIIDECHMLKEEAWDELLSIVEGGKDASMVFIMITEDANRVPRAVLSRCQKFSFQKLRDTDVVLKLARIVAREGIRIGRDALQLIAAKADGSLREAENILDQLALIESKITSCMVQQLVGLVPQNELTRLLDTAISGDAVKTVRWTRELITSGVKPQVLISQLASIISDILSEDPSSKEKRESRNQSPVGMHRQSTTLCHALKILVETDKHLPLSSDPTTWVIAAMVQIASSYTLNGISMDILLPEEIVAPADMTDSSSSRRNSTEMNSNGFADLVRQRKPRTRHITDGTPQQPKISNQDVPNRSQSNEEKGTSKMIQDMEVVWQDMLGRINSQYLKEFLGQKGKLISLTVSRANAIVHLMFKHMEDKIAAEVSEETISKALNEAFGCPVTVTMSLQPSELEMTSSCIASSSSKSQVADSGYLRQPNHSQSEQLVLRTEGQRAALRHSTSQKSGSLSENSCSRPRRSCDRKQVSQRHEASASTSYHIPTFSGHLTQRIGKDNEDPEADPFEVENSSSARSRKTKQQRLSLSSIPQEDGSVEPYSQDLWFENGKKDGQKEARRNMVLQRSFSKGNESHKWSITRMVLNRSRSCTDMICNGRIVEAKGGKLTATMGRRLLKWATCKVSSLSSNNSSKKKQVDLRKTVPTSPSCLK
ncbi:hypothetical protein ACLOJK_037704 [Asimina triloba]